MVKLKKNQTDINNCIIYDFRTNIFAFSYDLFATYLRNNRNIEFIDEKHQISYKFDEKKDIKQQINEFLDESQLIDLNSTITITSNRLNDWNRFADSIDYYDKSENSNIVDFIHNLKH
jgi:hypothetical protein